MNIDTAPVKLTSHKSALYEKLAYISIIGLTFLSPLIAIPYTSNLIQTSKWLLLVVSSLLIASSYLLFIFSKRKFQQLITPLSWPLMLFGVTTIISSITMNAYPNKSLIGFGGAYLALAFLGLFGGNLIQRKKAIHFVDALGLSGAILSITNLLQMVGWGPSRIFNQFFVYNLPDNTAFSLTGSGMISLQVISLAVLGVVAKIIIKKKIVKFRYICST